MEAFHTPHISQQHPEQRVISRLRLPVETALEQWLDLAAGETFRSAREKEEGRQETGDGRRCRVNKGLQALVS